MQQVIEGHRVVEGEPKGWIVAYRAAKGELWEKRSEDRDQVHSK